MNKIMLKRFRGTGYGLLLLPILLGTCCHLFAAEPLLETKDLFVGGQDNFRQYRIPSLVTTDEGTLIAVCDGAVSTGFDAVSNTDLVLKRSSDRGRTWRPMKVISDPGNGAAVDQCVIVDHQTDTVSIFYDYLDGKAPASAGRKREFRNVRLHVINSRDDGQTWSKPATFGEGLMQVEWEALMMAPGRGTQTRDGRLLVPCYVRRTDADYSHVLFSDDNGRSWQITAGAGPKTTECHVVELSGGSWMLNMRSYRGMNCRAVATSADSGKTWRIVDDQNLPETGCQGSLVRYTDVRNGYQKNRLLFSNPASTSQREKLTIRLSYDDGKSWPVAKLLDAGPSGYSCLTVLNDGSIGILYEAGHSRAGEKLTFARFNLDWLTDGRDSLRRVAGQIK